MTITYHSDQLAITVTAGHTPFSRVGCCQSRRNRSKGIAMIFADLSYFACLGGIVVLCTLMPVLIWLILERMQ